MLKSLFKHRCSIATSNTTPYFRRSRSLIISRTASFTTVSLNSSINNNVSSNSCNRSNKTINSTKLLSTFGKSILLLNNNKKLNPSVFLTMQTPGSIPQEEEEVTDSKESGRKPSSGSATRAQKGDENVTSFKHEESRQNQPQQHQQQKKQKKEEEEDINYDDPEEVARRERIEQKSTEADKQKFLRNVRFSIIGLGLLCSGTILIMGMPKSGEPDNEANPDETFLEAYWRRAKENIQGLFKETAAPVYGEKLLPDVVDSPYTRPYTLVIELNDSLVHMDWDKDIGWRIATRPGMKHFIQYLNNYFEIVVFANTPGHLAQPVMDTVDKFGFAPYRLYRESTRFVDGKWIKDLATLNRDLNKVICVDINPEAYSLQPENGLYLKPWKGEKGDKNLEQMMNMLEEMVILAEMAQLADIRFLLKAAKKVHPENPMEGWRLYKEHITNEQKAKIQQQQQSQPHNLVSVFKSFSRSSSRQSSEDELLFGRIEKLVQERRKQHSIHIKEQLAEMEKYAEMMEKERMKQIEGMKAKNMKMLDYMFGEPPAPPINAPSS